MAKKRAKSKLADVALTPRELSLVGLCQEIFSEWASEKGKLPSCDHLRKLLRCSQSSAIRIKDHVVETGIPGLEQKLRVAANRLRHEKLAKTALIDATMGEKSHHTQEEYLLRELALARRNLEKARLYANVARAVQRDLSRRMLTAEDTLVSDIKEVFKSAPPLRIEPSLKTRPREGFEMPFDEDHEEDAVLWRSDQHFGARTRRVDVSGFPGYNSVIAANRHFKLVKSTIKILKGHTGMYPLRRLVYGLGGDTGQGSLHDSPMSNELFEANQVHFAFLMVEYELEKLLSLIPNVITEGITVVNTVGNHMRMDEKMPMSYQAQRTLDWLVYKFVYERFKSKSGIQFVDDDGPFVFHNIRGHKYCFTHGTGASYENDPDSQVKKLSAFVARVRAVFDSPVFRKSRVKIDKESLSKVAGETFSRMVIGNIHVPISMPMILTNGSYPGQNELGVNWMLEPIPAGQWMWGVSRRHVKTWEYFIDFTDVQERGDNELVRFARDYVKRYGR